MRLSMPPFGLTDAGLNFVKQLGVQWITMGGPGHARILPEGRSSPTQRCRLDERSMD